MLRSLFGKKYRTLNNILVSKSALEYNHKALQAFHPEAKIVPVVKSNAYGHGLKLVATVLDDLKPAFLAVNSLEEANELTSFKIKAPVLILGYIHPDNISVNRLPFHITVFDMEVAKALNKNRRNCKIHIFVDTGMCREGVSLIELRGFVKELKKMQNLNIVGLASHLADADNPSDDSSVKNQIANYKKALNILIEEGIDPLSRHISASGGAFKIKDPMFNMIRAGLATYGINPLGHNDPAYKLIPLKPVLSFISTLVQIKTVSPGEKVGYNGTFTAKKNLKIGLLPLGYNEGVDRRLSNKGVVTINGTICTIIGRVSMNMTSVDISHVKNPNIGDEVIVYSNIPSDANSLVNASKTAGTIPYDLMVRLAESVKRIEI